MRSCKPRLNKLPNTTIVLVFRSTIYKILWSLYAAVVQAAAFDIEKGGA
jgi:hypothetical protein